LNKTGPLESNLIRIAIIKKTGQRMIIAIKDNVKSIILFKYFLYITFNPQFAYMLQNCYKHTCNSVFSIVLTCLM
jgi:hypothetical protein